MSEEMLALKMKVVELERVVGEISERLTALEEYNIGSGVIIDGVADGYREVLKKQIGKEDNR